MAQRWECVTICISGRFVEGVVFALDLENEWEFIKLKVGRGSSEQKKQCEQSCALVSLCSPAWMGGARLRKELGLNEKARDVGKNQGLENSANHSKDLNFILQEH